MTLLFMDGFEGQDGNALWEVYSTIGGYSSTTRFSYGQSFLLNNTIAAFGKRVTASTDIYCGFACRFTALATLPIVTFLGDTGTTTHVVLTLNSNGSLDLKRGSTVLASAAAATIAINTWYYFELHVKVADSGGVAELRINGNSTPVITFSGDTKNAGTNTTVDLVQFGGANGVSFNLDDVYVCNGLGSTNNTYLGERRVYTLSPTGAGASTGLTASTGSNWQCVDELPVVSTDYAGSPTVGNRDSYATQDLPATPTTINGVALCTYAHKSDAGAASMKGVLRVSGTNYYGATRTLGTSQVPVWDYFETSPATSAAWTGSEVNAMEVGAEVA